MKKLPDQDITKLENYYTHKLDVVEFLLNIDKRKYEIKLEDFLKDHFAGNPDEKKDNPRIIKRNQIKQKIIQKFGTIEKYAKARAQQIYTQLNEKDLNLAKPIWARLDEVFKAHDNLSPEEQQRYYNLNRIYNEKYQ